MNTWVFLSEQMSAHRADNSWSLQQMTAFYPKSMKKKHFYFQLDGFGSSQRFYHELSASFYLFV